ncbi:MAG: hypothetical protein GKR94_15030 [Gammaproteobacteria bacterium]|nr:hypothetical protein [Gammaproteobacteria bacterium]
MLKFTQSVLMVDALNQPAGENQGERCRGHQCVALVDRLYLAALTELGVWRTNRLAPRQGEHR